ncbi:MAG TPA: DUF4388 domain-containing protein [Thermoanaerobaculia bacterium]|nr:DUF4388 domain-containing protein [Thermoanaerobaculia bacterium]
MERLAGELAVVDLRDIVRSLLLERESGVLEVTVEEGKRRLFFLDGQLYLPPTNPLAGQLMGQLRQPGGEARVSELMVRMAAVLHRWQDGFFTFDPGRAAVPPEAVGPLPTVELVLAGAVIDEPDAELLERLGGEGAEWSLSRGVELPSVRLQPGEAGLLDRLLEPIPIGTLLATEPDRRQTLTRLCRLEAIGLIHRHQSQAADDSLVTPELRRRFLERVGAELEDRPVSLDRATHREKVAGLLGRLGQISYYELLGVGGTADPAEIHSAYAELARLVHPSHAERLGLVGREEALSVLFERATEAYLVLSDPDRRSRYHQEVPAPAVVSKPRSELTPEKSREQAQRLFEQAREMLAREEYHYAYELLRRAVEADRRPEYFSLLAEVQQKNPKWLHHAADSLREAVLLDPQNMALRLELAALFEKMGDAQRAVATYRSILVRTPDSPEALAGLKRLGAPRSVPRPPAPSKTKKKGLLPRLFGRDKN